jgi:UDP-2,4-diacetamido-2,4,6-trideoxy-beta-L-altropyranose hydrolase
MKIAFRTDASLQIGSGHVMRCLTLADALRERGANCHFISREHPGHLADAIRRRGFTLTALPAVSTPPHSNPPGGIAPTLQLEHAAWLGCVWQTDADQTIPILATMQPDWLIVDHYALDQQWEKVLKPYYKKLIVIDDLADRSHSCDLLLDQNLGRQPQDYANLIPTHCKLLTGTGYALLRPEFAVLRAYSLQRREQAPKLKKLLITMGGVDMTNATGQVLEALQNCALPADCHITVVMGLVAPWLQKVRELAAQMPWPTDVLVDVNDMAQRMADSDLAIGAAGSTSWERCCLGLPTLMVVLADNQRFIASGLECAGAAIPLRLLKGDEFGLKLKNAVMHLVNNEIALLALSQAAANVTSGCGTDLVVAQMLGNYGL